MRPGPGPSPTPAAAGTSVAEPRLSVWIVVAAAIAAVGAGVLALPATPVAPLPDIFGRGELVGWCLLAVATGGLVFGPRDRRPPILASGLVGSAALLGAGPVACSAIGLAGALGGLRRHRGTPVTRIVAAALGGWAMPGVLAVAATAGGPVLGRGHPIRLAEVLALLALLAVAIPVIEAVGTRLILPPAQEVGVRHMVRRRLEPQTVLAALAVVAAMAYASIGAAAGLVVLLPAAAARIGFARHDDGRRAVAQTLAAMTVLPEWVGMVDVGHTARVRAVVEQAGVDLGLESRARRDVVRAAELHELGHLDGGVVRGDRGRVARSGAAVLAQAGMRDRVVEVVRATDPSHQLADGAGAVGLGAALVTEACDRDRRSPLHDVAGAATAIVSAVRQASVVAR